jgi:hypothetical protein
LNPTIRATEAGEGNQAPGMTIKVQMAKILSIVISQNTTRS